MTKDGHFVALHDIHLEKTTDVESLYPERHRKDGRWYALDFTLAEIKTLSVHERLGNRFPVGKSHFEVPTMEEAIELIQGLNQTMGRNVGIYPEIKGPDFHRAAGMEFEEKLVALLGRYGYQGPDAKVFIQCFDMASLKKIREEIKSDLPLVLLVSRHELQAEFRTEDGLKTAAAYVNGVGPDKNIIEANPDYVQWAHKAGLVVHPYTIRDDDFPKKYGSASEELKQFFGIYGVDGIFSDFSDTARAAIDALPE